MPWIITKDYLNSGPDDPSNRKGVGSKDCPKDWEKSLPDTFRLFDDDGELYYEGRFDSNADDCFDPLDWGAYDAGCVKLKYQEGGKGEWKLL